MRDNDAHLTACLAALHNGGARPLEILIVDDGSVRRLPPAARRGLCRLIRMPRPSGSFAARNRGAASARGDILVFVDSDVAVSPTTLSRIAARFDADPALDAVFGAYDTSPSDPRLVSRYRNLLHSFVHRTSHRSACTFWTGCGAVRRSVFLAHGGFTLDRLHLRDVEFGLRLWRAGRRLALDPEIQGKHLKRWTLASMVRTDVFHRGANWTELLLRERFLPDDLNLGLSQRLSVASVYVLAALAVLAALHPAWPLAAAAASLAALYLLLNRPFFAFLAAHAGPRFAAASVPLHCLYHFCCGLGLAAGLKRFFFDRPRVPVPAPADNPAPRLAQPG